MLGREGGERDADGLGVSSARDVEDLDRIVSNARHLGRLVAFHAGEKDSGDIDAALAYDPDFIVHATHATHDQLRQCTDLGIPIIVCPRSNWTLLPAADPVHPPIQKMLDLGCVVFLGTDNVMFVQPDMTAEMAFVHTVYHIEPKKILRMAVAGSSIAGDSFFIRKGIRANLFSIDPRFSNLRYSRNPVTSIVKRAISGITGTNVFNA
jgi:cytosine/adenosine deaminase-related metal-dependent hydrolase